MPEETIYEIRVKDVLELKIRDFGLQLVSVNPVKSGIESS